MRKEKKDKKKSVEERLEAGKADVSLPLSGLTLRLNINEEDRIAATLLLKWITYSGSLMKYVNEASAYENDKYN